MMGRHPLLSKGFSILEWLSTLVVLGVLIYIGFLSHRYYQLIDRRSEGTQALQDIAKTQVYFYRQNGRYGTLADVWPDKPITSHQYYSLQVLPQVGGYMAIAKTMGTQRDDDQCSQIVLTSQHGKINRYPAVCWGQSSK